MGDVLKCCISRSPYIKAGKHHLHILKRLEKYWGSLLDGYCNIGLLTWIKYMGNSDTLMNQSFGGQACGNYSRWVLFSSTAQKGVLSGTSLLGLARGQHEQRVTLLGFGWWICLDVHLWIPKEALSWLLFLWSGTTRERVEKLFQGKW